MPRTVGEQAEVVTRGSTEQVYFVCVWGGGHEVDAVGGGGTEPLLNQQILRFKRARFTFPMSNFLEIWLGSDPMAVLSPERTSGLKRNNPT